MVIRPHYLEALWAHKDKPLIKVLVGMRRCGKSTVLEMYRQKLAQSGVETPHIISMNFESGAFRAIRDDGDLYRYVHDRVPAQGKAYLLLDEVQAVIGWEKAVNAIRADFDADVTVTGSNAYLLSSELSTLLSGRYVEIEVFPLSFAEYLDFTAQLRPNQVSLGQERLFDQYLRQGGLPVLFEYGPEDRRADQVMEGLYSTIIRKDVLFRNQVADAFLLDRVASFLMDNVGSVISSKKITDTFRSVGIRTTHVTVLNYIEMLRAAYVFYAAKRYDLKGKEHLRTLDKNFLCDLGLRYALLGNRNADMGHLLENVVYLELRRRGFNVSVGVMDDYEVDFMAENRHERLYVQVAHSLQLPEVRERELRPLRLIRDNYPKMVLTRDYGSDYDADGIAVRSVTGFLARGDAT